MKYINIDTYNNTSTTPVMIVKYLSGDRFAETDEIKVVGQNLFAQVAALPSAQALVQFAAANPQPMVSPCTRSR